MSANTTTSEPNIIEAIEDYLNTYIVFPDPDYARIIALWTVHTYTFGDGFAERPWTTPYLYVNSVGPQSGKSLLIDLLEPLVRNPERAADMTAAVMFTLIEEVSPTLFIDELDTVNWDSSSEVRRGVLNGGYKRGGYVWRKEGREPVKFNTFGAKLLAGINNGKLPDTIATRSIFINMKKVATLSDEGELIAPDGTKREIYYHFMAGPVAEEIVAKIDAFMTTWTLEYERYMPKPVAGIPPRAFEIAMPLLQIAHRFGIEDETREALKRLMAPQPERKSAEVQMIEGILKAFDDAGTDKLHTEQICEALGEGWNGKLLGNRIKHLGVGSAQVMRIGNKDARGFYRYQFDSAAEKV